MTTWVGAQRAQPKSRSRSNWKLDAPSSGGAEVRSPECTAHAVTDHQAAEVTQVPTWRQAASNSATERSRSTRVPAGSSQCRNSRDRVAGGELRQRRAPCRAATRSSTVRPPAHRSARADRRGRGRSIARARSPGARRRGGPARRGAKAVIAPIASARGDALIRRPPPALSTSTPLGRIPGAATASVRRAMRRGQVEQQRQCARASQRPRTAPITAASASGLLAWATLTR